jgi:Ca-activated chloride channel family protein
MLNITVKPHRQCVRANSPDPQKLFVMFKLQPQASQLRAGPRPPVAIALVVDTSGSMAGDKLDKAKAAAHQLVDYPALTAQDQIALIQFQGFSQVLAPLAPLQNRAILHTAIDSLLADDGTMMGLGMQDGWNELRKSSGSSVKKMFLLTDGLTGDEDQCRLLAKQMANENVSITAFGIGTEYNHDLLINISDLSRGGWYHLTDMSRFSEHLQQQLEVALKEAITNVRASLKAVRGVSVTSLRRIHPSIIQISPQNSIYPLGNLPSDTVTVFIADLSLPERQPGRVRLAQVEFIYDIPGLNRKDERLTSEIVVEYTTDERRAAMVDPEVMSYVQQSNITKLVDEAIQAAKTGQVQKALQTLNVAKGMTQNLGNVALTKVLEKAEQELQETGTISPDMVKTVKADARTKTVSKDASGKGLSDEEIRKVSGT